MIALQKGHMKIIVRILPWILFLWWTGICSHGQTDTLNTEKTGYVTIAGLETISLDMIVGYDGTVFSSVRKRAFAWFDIPDSLQKREFTSATLSIEVRDLSDWSNLLDYVECYIVDRSWTDFYTENFGSSTDDGHWKWLEGDVYQDRISKNSEKQFALSPADLIGRTEVGFSFRANPEAPSSWSSKKNEIILNNPTLILTYPLPDLMFDQRLSELSVSGNQVSISVRVSNREEAESGEFHIGYFLSADTIVDNSDYLIAEHTVPNLPAGTYIDDTLKADVTEVHPVIPEGTYYVGCLADYRDTVKEVNEENNTIYFKEPLITVIPECPDPYEPNDSLETATDTVFNPLDTTACSRSVSATLHSPADMDIYRLDVTAAGALAVSLPAPPDDFNCDLTDDSGAPIPSSGHQGTDTVLYSLDSAGYYYIRVYSRMNEFTCTGYTLSVQWTPIIPDKYLKIFPDSLEVYYEAGSDHLSVKANVKWEVIEDVPWLSAVKIDESTIGVSYDENGTITPRTGLVIATGPEGLSDTAMVIQDRGPAFLDVSPNSINAGYESGSGLFSVSSNVSWEVSDDAPWLTAVKTNENTIIVSYETNYSTEERTANITAEGAEGVSETVQVTQAGAPAYLNIAPNHLDVGFEAGSDIFTVSTNVTWMVGDDADWLTAVKANESTIIVSFETNYFAVARTAALTAEGEGGVSETVTVTQAAAPAYLEVSPGIRNVGAQSDSTTFNVASNVDWTVTDNVSWLIATKTDDSMIKVFYFTNPYDFIRSAAIIAMGTQGVSDTVSVIQLGKNMSTGIIDAGDGGIRIYPNPSEGRITIEWQVEGEGDVLVQMIDPAGKILVNERFGNRSSLLKTTFELGNQPSGIYAVKVMNNRYVFIRKIIIEH